MTATGLVVTDLSHLDVGLNRQGDFREPVRFAVSSKASRPARRQSVPPQAMRPYNHPSRLCAASSRASHNSMPGLQPARSRWASAAIWSAVCASATSRHRWAATAGVKQVATDVLVSVPVLGKLAQQALDHVKIPHL
jgi:hypothetical protein